jgi:hypothetical protein
VSAHFASRSSRGSGFDVLLGEVSATVLPGTADPLVQVARSTCRARRSVRHGRAQASSVLRARHCDGVGACRCQNYRPACKSRISRSAHRVLASRTAPTTASRGASNPKDVTLNPATTDEGATCCRRESCGLGLGVPVAVHAGKVDTQPDRHAHGESGEQLVGERHRWQRGQHDQHADEPATEPKRSAQKERKAQLAFRPKAPRRRTRKDIHRTASSSARSTPLAMATASSTGAQDAGRSYVGAASRSAAPRISARRPIAGLIRSTLRYENR